MLLRFLAFLLSSFLAFILPLFLPFFLRFFLSSCPFHPFFLSPFLTSCFISFFPLPYFLYFLFPQYFLSSLLPLSSSIFPFPSFIITGYLFLSLAGTLSTSLLTARIAFLFAGIANSALNPLVYAFRMKALRKALKWTLKKLYTWFCFYQENQR